MGGLSSSQQPTSIEKTEQLLNPAFKGDTESLIQDIIASAGDIDTSIDLPAPEIKPESIPQLKAVLAALISFIHARAIKANAMYAGLKEGKMPEKIDDGIQGRLILLQKMLEAAIQHAVPLSEYLWHVDGMSFDFLRVKPIIKAGNVN